MDCEHARKWLDVIEQNSDQVVWLVLVNCYDCGNTVDSNTVGQVRMTSYIGWPNKRAGERD